MARLGSMLLLLAVGCAGNGKDPTTPPGDDDDDDDVETAHTGGEGPAPKLVAEVRFRAFIAWDATLGEVVNPVIDGTEYLSAYMVELYEAGWSDADETSYCDVYVELSGTRLAEGVVQEGFLWGIDIPAGLDGKSGGSDCLDDGFDPAQFDQGDPVAQWASYDWQLRFGGELSAELTDWLTPDTPSDEFDIENYAAGGWSSETAGYETELDSNYWYAYPMDAEHVVDFESLIPRILMTDGNGDPTTAYFVFDQRVYWNIDPPTTE